MKRKLLLLYILMVIIPFIIISNFIIIISQEKLNQKAADIMKISSAELSSSLKLELFNYVKTVNRISVDSRLSSCLSLRRQYTDDVELMEIYRNTLYPAINFATYENVVGVHTKIYYYNESLRSDHEIFFKIDSSVSQTMLKNAKNNPRKTLFDTQDSTVNFYRAIINSDSQVLGLIVVSVDTSILLSALTGSAHHSNILLADKNLFSIVSTDPKIPPRQDLTPLLDQMTVDSHGNSYLKYEKEQFQVFCNKISFGNNCDSLWMFNFIPVEQLAEDASTLRNFTISLCLACAVLSAIMVSISLNAITHRIRMLQNHMNNLNSDLIPMDPPKGHDEISELTNHFNRMILDLKKGISEKYDAQANLQAALVKQREAELYALQSQVNPHFLFNILESIRMQTYQKGDYDTSTVISRLSILLRSSLTYENDLIPLKDEIVMVESYLELQKYRYGNRIRFSIYVDEAVEKFLLPKLSIQPLVDNAIHHGLEGKVDGGFVDVLCELQGQQLVIIVQDNGLGISPERLSEIRSTLYNQEIKGSKTIGLKNVYDRFCFYYGEDFSMDISNMPENGTQIVIRISQKRVHITPDRK